jgi:hypothetical protein
VTFELCVYAHILTHNAYTNTTHISARPQEPAGEPEEAVRAPVVTVAAERPPVMRNDGIEGDDMSDGEDDVRGGDKKTKGGRGIFESIIAKWSSLGSAPPAGGRDSDDEGGGEGEAGDYDDGDSGDICPPLN